MKTIITTLVKATARLRRMLVQHEKFGPDTDKPVMSAQGGAERVRPCGWSADDEPIRHFHRHFIHTANTFRRSLSFLSCTRHMLLTSAVLAIMPLHAEPADEPKPAAKAPDSQSSAAEPATGLAAAIGTASRFVDKEQLSVHVRSITTIFTIAKRTTDPFGLPQDPNAKPVIKPKLAKSTRVTPAYQATPFSEIVRMIKVTTIMPNERRFLIGTRSVRQGDSIPISFRGRNINVEVAAVSSRKIEFRNLDNGETASLPLNLLPAGMTPGTGGITAPGMVPDRPNAPLMLDSSHISMDDSSNANSSIR